MKDKCTDNQTDSTIKRLPGIQLLLVVSILFVGVLGLVTVSFISTEIEKNTAHNNIVLKLSRHIEEEAILVSQQMLPVYQALHAVDVAVTRHAAEFELYVLDSDRDSELLAKSLSELEKIFSLFPENIGHNEIINHQDLEEVVSVFTDITHEALEVRSPNKLFQLLDDSEDIFSDFRSQLDETRTKLDSTVSAMGDKITKDLQTARSNITLQQHMLKRLKTHSYWGLLALILVILIVAIMLSHSLQRRLGSVATYAHDIADGKYNSSMAFISNDKLGEMAKSVNHMGSSMAALVNELGDKAEAAKRSAREVKRLAYYDSLTGLPNRHHFMEKLEYHIETARRSGGKLAVAYLDLDGFKKINDVYGHSLGDKLLISVADRLAQNMRGDDIIARNTEDSYVFFPSRLGGDEFTFLFDNILNESEAEKIVDRILNALSKPHTLDERELSITPSIGVAIFPDDGTTINDLMKHSDMAMYNAKENGRNNVKLYNEKISARQVESIKLERDLAKALENAELSIYYQAKVDLGSHQIVGVEALLRWLHPERGVISPVEFIPLAEESGMIVPIGNWVLQQSCEQVVHWQAEGISPVPIAINVSAKQFAQSDFLSTINQSMGIADICKGNIELELTESVLMKDTELSVDTLNKLAETGIKVSLDDFGTGYSSLSYLKRFPLNTLKIDRSFVMDIETDEDDAAIIKAILALSKSMGLNVVAEGVENELQAGFLEKHGCQMAQGYLFSRPVPAQEFTVLLTQGTVASVA